MLDCDPVSEPLGDARRPLTLSPDTSAKLRWEMLRRHANANQVVDEALAKPHLRPHLELPLAEVPVRKLKDHLSEYLRRAQAGEEIVVTSHGRPVGRLVGSWPAQDDPETDALARLRAQPWVRPGNGEKVLGASRPASVPEGTTEELMRWVRGE